MHRTILIRCAVVVSAASCATLHGDVLVTDSRFAFDVVAFSRGLDLYDESLDEYSGFASEFSGGTGNWAWELSSSAGVLADDSLVQAGAGNTALELSFESEAVFAIGGEFLLLDTQGTALDGIIQLELSDGTTYISTVSNGQTFAGFISGDLFISSLSMVGFGAYAPDITAISSFTIGVVPAPGGLALLLLGGTAARRRRS